MVIEADTPAEISFAEFLTGVPLLQSRQVLARVFEQGSGPPTVEVPVISLFCASASCGGSRICDPSPPTLQLYSYKIGNQHNTFLSYICRNCHGQLKTFALRLKITGVPDTKVQCQKIGESPAFGEPRPNAVKDVLEDEIEYFERGYRAETTGLGIGAFAYYRRFVESHKDKLIATVRQVAVAQGANPETIAAIDRAAATDSFDKAVAAIKDAIPDSLRYSGGHNPLTLLHRALSGGIHSDDDIECLELAKDIRLLLTDLSERTTQALKNQDALGQAVNRLLKKGAKPAH